MSDHIQGPGAVAAPPNPRRWAALVFIGLAQLMIVLDVTIVNIALPSAQHDLGVSDGDRQWVITAYTLAFGSLLLLGGRIADYTGRRRAFLIGILGFAAASAMGGAAPDFAVLLTARALQGMFAALLSPTALSLLAVNFTEARERAKAFGVFGAIAAGGGAIGLLLGGLLTEYLDWRWCLYVNLPIAVVASFSWFVLGGEPGPAARRRFDVPGTLLAVAGLVSIVYGCSRADQDGWSSGTVIGLLVLGAVLLAMFAVTESRVRAPVLPPRIVADRTRGSAYLAVGLAVFGMFAMFLFLTYYMQLVKGYSPVKTGLAFLPMTGAVLIGAGGIASRLLPKVPPRALVVPGLLLAAAGTGWLTRLHVGSSYAAAVLPAELLLGVGMGLVMAPSLNYSTYRVGAQDAGVASATVNTMQQIGGSIGTALLNTIATTATGDYLATRPRTPAVARSAAVHGFTAGFKWASVILVAAAFIVGALMNTRRPEQNRAPRRAGVAEAPAQLR